MNSIQEQLVAMLRSGELEQTPVPSNTLCTGMKTFSFSGMVCELYRIHHPGEAEWISGRRGMMPLRFEGRDHHTSMPGRIARWMELRDPWGNIRREAEPLLIREKWKIHDLTSAYESGMSFGEIAALIEERSRDIFSEQRGR